MYDVELPCGRVLDRVAWTGGSTPAQGYADANYRHVRRIFFRESLRICGGLDLWACAGTTALERARIFWSQARLDAWRTIERAGL